MRSAKNSVDFKSIRTNSVTPRPVVWKFKNEDYATIRKEYKSIREKSSLKLKSTTAIRAEHRAFAERYPQLYVVATSPEICDKNVDMILDMSEKAKEEGKDNMDVEASNFGQKICDEHADPSRKKR